MGFIDKMCYEVAKEIINDIFLIKYKSFISNKEEKYVNLNEFIEKEYLLYHDQNIHKTEFTEKEIVSIIREAKEIVCQKLKIDSQQIQKGTTIIEWEKFSYIINHYLSLQHKLVS